MELPGGDGINHILSKHEILYIGSGNQYTLISGKASRFAQIEEAFDFLIHAADRLYLSELVYGACDGERLFDRQFSNCRQKSLQLCRRRAVPLHSEIQLLEYEARRA